MGEERNPNRDAESGKYQTGFEPADALDALEALGGMATTSEVGEEMGCARRTAYNKLRPLDEDGTISSRDAGGSRLWILD
jgi:GTP-sensing pleiotropic transcriptional regulator CodY